eukprot:GHVP01056943.1.p1 GENE.GHVP01056943.1~~GHVP01056943.1.p1  ORF type:complete len:433 (-),score=64.16 GHVP01056943.1:67-1365(-)
MEVRILILTCSSVLQILLLLQMHSFCFFFKQLKWMRSLSFFLLLLKIDASFIAQFDPYNSFESSVPGLKLQLADKKFTCQTPKDEFDLKNSLVDKSSFYDPDDAAVRYLIDSKMAWTRGLCAIFSKKERYWSYELCIGKSIIQYSGASKDVTENQILVGLHDPQKDQLFSNGSVIQHFVDGEDGRHAVLRCICSEFSPHFDSVKESKPKFYEIVMRAPAFCDWTNTTAETADLGTLLSPLEGKCLNLTVPNEYWSYEYCHPNALSQFHKNQKGEVEGDFYKLGIHRVLLNKQDTSLKSLQPALRETTAKFLNTRAVLAKYMRPLAEGERSPYIGLIEYSIQSNISGEGTEVTMKMELKDGTKCVENEKPRISTINFFCTPTFQSNSVTAILQVVEKNICQYEATIVTPLVCPHPDLIPPPPKRPKTISCLAA